MTRETITWEPTGAERAEAEWIVSRLSAVRAEKSRLEAEEARLLAAALQIAVGQVRRAGGPTEWDMPVRSMTAEIAAALREGPRTIERRMVDADALVTDFPSTLAALEEGHLSGRHAAVITSEGVRIGDGVARAEYEERAMRVAKASTVGALRSMCRVLADSADLAAAALRHELARGRRHVRVCPLDDGMAELRLVAPVPLVQGIHDRLTTMARTVIAEREREAPDDGAADTRGVDELRADLACDLLLTGSPGANTIGDEAGQLLLREVRGVVQVTIPVGALTGEKPISGSAVGAETTHGVRGGERPPGGGRSGFGRGGGTATSGGEPIDDATARRIAGAAAGWERLFHDPDSGALATVDHYLPTAAQRRFLRARDEHCRFPGCRQSARRCEGDHIVPHSAGGPTDVANLQTVCKRHHMLKHHSPWQVRHLGSGELEWTSPLGYRYRGQPISTVRFTEIDGAGDGRGSVPVHAEADPDVPSEPHDRPWASPGANDLVPQGGGTADLTHAA